MAHEDWDYQWMGHARLAASTSDDSTKQVGCVIVDPRNNRMVINGANTLPDGVRKLPQRVAKPYKFDWIEHAERNAIYRAARHGFSLNGCVMYLPWFPCHECARAIVQSGIAELVAVPPDFSHHKWGRSHELATEILDESQVQVRYYEENQIKRLSRLAS